MKRKILALCLPIGLIIELIYKIVNSSIYKISDKVAYPLMIVSVLLMLIGLAYNGYCFRKHENPYNFK